MKHIASYSLFFLLFAFQISGLAQTKSPSKVHLSEQYSFFENKDTALSHYHYFEAMRGQMRLSEQSKMVLTNVVEGENGYIHYKYEQQHEGLPIFGNTYVLHEKAGRVTSASGLYSPQMKQPAHPDISAATAISLAKSAMKAEQYAETMLQPTLCFVDPAFPRMSESTRLSYQIDLHSTKPFDKQRYFIDAHSGKVIRHFPLVLEEGVPSKAKTKYYGTQNIVTDSLAPNQFVLRDPGRGGGIVVKGTNGSAFTNTNSNWDLTNQQQDEVALDAHYCTQEYFDMMLKDYDWEGIDGKGKALIAVVHKNEYGGANAFWDGTATNYGDGDCNYGPLTTLEVVGHEFTHGLIEYTSNLVYDQEPGAINESLADMFGKMLERKKDPLHFSWNLGHSFSQSPTTIPFRKMSDPKSLKMPAYYRGEYWEDRADVHINSSIGNLWFSMLVDGKQGINEAGFAFNIPALGMEKVGKIIFLVNNAYFTSSSDYQKFLQYALLAADELYGANSIEKMAVLEAWKAVGIVPTQGQVFDLATISNYFDNNHCGLNNFVTVSVQIANRGDLKYLPAMNAQVNLSAFGYPDYSFQLNDTIEPGELLTMEVSDWLLPTESEYINIFTKIDLDDEDADNNEGILGYYIVEYDAGDIDCSYVSIGSKDCLTGAQKVFFSIFNKSCTSIPAGTTLNLTLEDAGGNLLWSAPYTLADELFSFAAIQTVYNINISSTDSITFKVNYPNDPDWSNNTYKTLVFSHPKISSEFLVDFNQELDPESALEFEYFSPSPLLLYQGESFFGSTGVDTDPDWFQPCPNYADNFSGGDYLNGINATIRGCLDFSAAAAPVLEFDLAQFRNTAANASGDLHTAMLQAKWTGSQSGDIIFLGQQDGAIEHHIVPLPPYFKGELKLQFYTQLGNYELRPSNLSTDDFILLDNLKLITKPSGTDEKTDEQRVRVSPNPAQNKVSIQTEKGIKSITLCHIGGQVLRQLDTNADRVDLDLNGLPDGFYLLTIALENNQSVVRKLVKMD